MGASARDVVQSLGDALAGVNRNNEYLKGEQLGADVDEKRAQTEAAMTLARQHRIEAEISEAKKARQDQIAAATAAQLTAPDAPIGTMIAGGMGGDYASATQGMLHSQELGERRTIATPAPIGDAVADANRQAALEALAPSAAISAQSGRGAPVVARDPDTGEDVYVTPHDATSNRMRPGSKPAPTPAAPTRSREVDYLVQHGWEQSEAEQLVFGQKANPESLYNAVYSTSLRNYDSEEEAQRKAKAAVTARFGAEAGTGAKQPKGPTSTDHEEWNEGDVVEDAKGNRLTLRGGKWVPVEQ